MRCVACYGAGKRGKRTHVATYSSRGVGLHARRPGESTTAVPIPEALRQGEGGISQPFRRSHQARGSFAPKGGIRGGSHRGRPYGPRTRKRRPGHLRVHIRRRAYRREEMGAHLRRPRLQHPSGATTLPRPKRRRVSGTRASVEGGKPNPPARWSLPKLPCFPSYSPKCLEDVFSEDGMRRPTPPTRTTLWSATTNIPALFLEAQMKGGSAHG